MAELTNSIRLNDYMSSTLRTINQTMERTLSIMRRLDAGLHALGEGRSLNPLEKNLGAVLSKFQLLKDMIESIGTGAGPRANVLDTLQDQLKAAGERAKTLAEQLFDIGSTRAAAKWLIEAESRIVWQDPAVQPNAARSASQQDSGWHLDYSSLLGELPVSGQFLAANISQITEIANTFGSANAQLSQLNDGLRTQQALQQLVLDTANHTRTSYTATAALMASLSGQGPFQGDNEAATRFAEMVNKTFALSGATPAQANDALLGLSQALSSGALSGQAFNAVLDHGSRFAQALAASLGVSIGQLQQMAQDGQLTAQVIAEAMLKQGDAIDEAFAKMPLTFGQNIEALKNMLGGFLADISASGGALDHIGRIFTSLVNFLTQNSAVFDILSGSLLVVTLVLDMIAGGLERFMQLIDALGPVFDAVVNTIIILLLLEAASSLQILITGFMEGLNLAMRMGQAVAMISSPIFWIAVAVGAAIAAFNSLGGTISDVVSFAGGLIGALIALVLNMGIHLMNSFLTIAEFFGNVFKDPVYAIQNLFYQMVDNIIGFLNGLIDAIRSGLNWLLTKVSDVTGLEVGHIAEWVIENPLTKPTRDNDDLLDFEQLDYVSYTDWAQKGADIGMGFLQKINEQTLPTMDNTSTVTDIGSVERVARIGKIDDDVSIADEDMKMMMELAIQNRVNQINLTVQTKNSPNITQNNTVNTELDIAEVANSLAAGMYETNQVTVEQDY